MLYFCRCISTTDPLIYIAFLVNDFCGVLFEDWIFFFSFSRSFCCFSLQSWDIFQDFVSSFWVLSAHLIIWLTSLRCLVFNTNWAKPPFWFELLLSVFLTSVLVLISFNVFFFCGESSSTTHFSGYSFGGGSFTRGGENYFFYSIHFESNDACKITPYWNIFQLLFWWLISQFSFSLKVWSSKVRCSMKSLNCGKVCVESFQAHRGRKIIFFNSKYGSSSLYISFWSWCYLSSFLQNPCLYDIRKKSLRIHQSYLLPENKKD